MMFIPKYPLVLAFELLEREGGDEDVVIPAIILHDTGWKRVPADLHLKAFGPNTSRPELNRLHEVEGVKIAEEILQQVNYDSTKTKEDSGDHRRSRFPPEVCFAKRHDRQRR